MYVNVAALGKSSFYERLNVDFFWFAGIVNRR
jgi:hypothetical protein